MSPFSSSNIFAIFAKNSMIAPAKRFPFIFPVIIIFTTVTSCKTTGKISKQPVSTNKADHFYEVYSAVLRVHLTGNENRKLVSTVADWLGTPYKYGGCDKAGTDCSCLVRNIIKEVYGVDMHRSSEDMILDVKKVNMEDLRDGDLVFFKINGNKISHVGIYIADQKFVHASKMRGVVINDLNETYYSKCFYTGGRIKS